MSSNAVDIERSPAKTIVAVFGKTSTREVLSINLTADSINVALAGLGVADVLATAATVFSRTPQIDFGELLLILESLLLAQLGRARR